MSHLWIKDEERQWAALPLADESLLLSVNPPSRVRDLAALEQDRARVLLLPCTRGRRVLLWGPGRGVRLNGIPLLALGLRILRDRDEIRVSGASPLFFSTERLAKVEPFPGGDRPVRCARSKLPIAQGTPAVCCPQCDLWYIQTAEHPAWTYGDSCSCGHPTDLNAGFQWIPEEEI